MQKGQFKWSPCLCHTYSHDKHSDLILNSLCILQNFAFSFYTDADETHKN
jgi:hypothetical protein